MTPIRIERLSKAHVRDAFDCGEPSLDLFIRSIARQHDDRGLGRTFVAVREGSPVVLGYYTLAVGKVAFEHVPEARKLPRIPIPVVLLGRLAVDRTAQGAGLGETLLMHALWRTLRIADQAGVYAVEVDAVSEPAVRFYRRYGFTPLLDDTRHLYLPMKVIRALDLESRVHD